VLIPAYNEAAFIGDTIRSVLEQSVDVDDVIVVDDRSTDARATWRGSSGCGWFARRATAVRRRAR
jgi:GT2 family glycosyltransferase